jgi:hypothetical protein
MKSLQISNHQARRLTRSAALQQLYTIEAELLQLRSLYPELQHELEATLLKLWTVTTQSSRPQRCCS